MGFALVQTTNGKTQLGTQILLTLPAVTAGNLIPIFVVGDSSATSAPTVTDSVDTVESALAWQGGTYDAFQAIYYVQNASAGSHTITITFPSGVNAGASAAEFSGAATSSALGPVAALSSGDSSSPTTNSVTPPLSGMLAVAMFSDNGYGTTAAVNSPLTNGDSVDGAPAGVWGYQQLSSIAAFSGSGTLGNNTAWAASAALFYPPLTQITGGGSASASASGSLTTGIRLAAAASDVTSAAGVMGIYLYADAQDSSSASAALSTAIQMAAAATDSESAAATLTNWSSVVLAAPLYTGVGSILDANGPWSNGAPGAGDTVYYDGTHMTIDTDGEIVATSNNFSALCQWSNGGTWSELTVIVMPGPVAYAQVASTAIGSLSTAIQLLASANAISNATANFTTQAKLQGAANAVSSATANLATAIQAAAAAVDSSIATATLVGTSNALAGTAADTTSASAALNAQITMVGAATSVVSSVGDLATQIRLSANALSVTSAIGSVQTGIPSSAQAIDSSSATASLLTGIPLAAAASAFSAASGALLTQIPLIGSASDTSGAQAQVSTKILMVSAAQAVATAIAALSTVTHFAASGQSGSAASGALSSGIQLDGVAQDSSASVADLTSGAEMAAHPASESTASGALGAPPRFGWMDVVAQGQASFAGGEATYLAGSTCTVNAEYFDLNGNPFEPESVQYRIDDVLSGENILPWTNLEVATSNLVVITAVQNAMINATRLNEQHQVIFAVTDGYGSEPYLGRVIFNVQSAAGLN